MSMPDYGIALLVIAVIIAFGVVCAGILYMRVHKHSDNERFGSILKQPIPFRSIIPIKIQPSDSSPERTCEVLSESEFPEDGMTKERKPGESLTAQYKASRDQWSSGECNDAESICGSDSFAVQEWKVWAKLSYQPEMDILECTLFRACTEPFRPIEPMETPSLFAQVCLLPDETQKQQSSIYINSGSASFDETFKFEMTPATLKQQIVRVSLYEQDQEHNRKCLGHAFLELAELSCTEPTFQYMNKLLQSLPMPDNKLGEANVTLCYNPKSQKLAFEVKDIRNVNLPKTAVSNYRVRLEVIVGSKTAKVKKGDIKHTIGDAIQFSYNMRIAHKHMDTTCLRFLITAVPAPGEKKDVSDSGYGGGSFDKPLGHILIGPCMYTHGTGLDHWKQMLANMRKPIERWHVVVIGSAPHELPE